MVIDPLERFGIKAQRSEIVKAPDTKSQLLNITFFYIFQSIICDLLKRRSLGDNSHCGDEQKPLVIAASIPIRRSSRKMLRLLNDQSSPHRSVLCLTGLDHGFH